MTIEEAFVELENYVDASDPDMDLVRVHVLISFAISLLFAFHSPFVLHTFLMSIIAHLSRHFPVRIIDSEAQSASPPPDRRGDTQVESTRLAPTRGTTARHGKDYVLVGERR
jgi:hypothetical protein